jgi:hypothetical protein
MPVCAQLTLPAYVLGLVVFIRVRHRTLGVAQVVGQPGNQPSRRSLDMIELQGIRSGAERRVTGWAKMELTVICS